MTITGKNGRRVASTSNPIGRFLQPENVLRNAAHSEGNYASGFPEVTLVLKITECGDSQ
jgi:hypothetical protein